MMTPEFTLPPEPRPSDFAARFSRGQARGIGARVRRKHRGRRALVLLAAIAVPAIAAPEGWQNDWSTSRTGEGALPGTAIEPMPFEKPGDSFPGSAFYYLAADEPAQGWSTLAPDAHSWPVARALRVSSSGVDRSRALQCLTAAIYYEAASEPDAGQRAVAQVVLNRVAHPSYPNTVCGVVYQGSERASGCQFSFTCDGSLARRPDRFFWKRAENVARTALSGFVDTTVGLATHYHTIAVHPGWADRLAYVRTIGAHRFYSFGGAAGRPGAFRFAYAGGEPLAAPHPHNSTIATGADMALDPFANQRAFVTEPGARQAGRIATPVYSPELQQRGGDALYFGAKLPQASAIRPEYRNSGRWIAEPGTSGGPKI